MRESLTPYSRKKFNIFYTEVINEFTNKENKKRERSNRRTVLIINIEEI